PPTPSLPGKGSVCEQRSLETRRLAVGAARGTPLLASPLGWERNDGNWPGLKKTGAQVSGGAREGREGVGGGGDAGGGCRELRCGKAGRADEPAFGLGQRA